METNALLFVVQKTPCFSVFRGNRAAYPTLHIYKYAYCISWISFMVDDVMVIIIPLY